jgi:UDP-glucuronate 4-epimerase
MKILITGVAGFIGSHLADTLLKSGFEVYGIDNLDDFYPRDVKLKNISQALTNPAFHFFEFDITEKNAFHVLNNEKFDKIFHIAARAGVRPSIEAPEKYIKTNIAGTLNVLEYMRASKSTKLIFASSSSVYGNCKVIPFTEETSVDELISPYAFTKKSCELLNYNYHHLYGLDIINLRFFTVFGPRQRPDLAIYKFMDRIEKNLPIEVYGDGSTARDYTYVDDIISGIISAGEYLDNNKQVYEIINLGNNSPVVLLDLIKTMQKCLNKEFEVVYKDMQMGDVDITFANIEKAKNLLGYEPKISFEEGISNFINWYYNK